MLKDKKIVIIGGTSGIGLSAAKAFVNHGARVVAFGLEPEKDPEISNCTYLIGDARDEHQVKAALQKCISEYGGLDGLYHVAGGSGRKWGDGPLHELTKDAWVKTLELNLDSVMVSNKLIIRYWLEHKQAGSILNLSTLLATDPSPKHFHTHAYAAAKSAIIGFSKSVASYYAQFDIRINVLSPGLVDTPMAQRAAENEDILKFIRTKQPLDGGRMLKAADLDGAAVYFLSDYSASTTGQVLGVDGGWSISEGQY